MAAARGSIKWEIAVFISVLITVVTAGISFLVLDTQKRSLTNEVKLRGLSIANNLASNVADFILTEDELSTASLLKAAMDNNGARYAFVADAGVIKAHNNIDLNGSRYNEIKDFEIIEDPKYDIRLYRAENGEKVIDFKSAVLAKGKLNLGELHFGLSYGVIEKVLKEAFLNVLVIALIAVALGITGSIMLAMTITKPIGILAEGAKMIGAGRLEHQIKVKSRNEIGQLAAIFNMMTVDLKKAQEAAIKHNRLERELEVAREIQMSLIPKAMERIPGFEVAAYYEPAKEVGGDYYDLIALPDGRFGIVMGDVSGKGVPAAFMMTMARSILHSEAPAMPDPATAMKRLNKVIYPDMKDGMFITVFYAMLAPASGEVNMSSAGHNDTYVIRTAGNIEKYNPKGFAIGMDPGARFDKKIESQAVSMQNGDSLIVFTDGITEAMNAKNEEYADERLEKVCAQNAGKSAQETVEAIIKDVKAFVSGAAQSDDIAVLVIKKIK